MNAPRITSALPRALASVAACLILAASVGCSRAGGPCASFVNAADLGDTLVSSLMANGALEAAQSATLFSDGRRRNTIFAWFDSAQAVERWYYSRGHRDALRCILYRGAKDHVMSPPLSHVDRDFTGPVFVVASMSAGATPNLAIELFSPLAAGFAVDPKERLSPPSFEIPHFNDRRRAEWTASRGDSGTVSVVGLVEAEGPDAQATLTPLADDPGEPRVAQLGVAVSAAQDQSIIGPAWVGASVTVPDAGNYDSVRVHRPNKESKLVPIE